MFRSIEFYPYYTIILLTTYFGAFENIPKIYLVVKERASTHLIISGAQFIFNNVFILYFVVFCQEGAIGYLKGQLYGVVVSSHFLYTYLLNTPILFLEKTCLKIAVAFCLPIGTITISNLGYDFIKSNIY